MSERKYIADFCLKGASFLCFSFMGGVLSSAVSGKFSDWAFPDKAILGGMVIFAAVIAVIFLANGWFASRQERLSEKSVAKFPPIGLASIDAISGSSNPHPIDTLLSPALTHQNLNGFQFEFRSEDPDRTSTSVKIRLFS